MWTPCLTNSVGALYINHYSEIYAYKTVSEWSVPAHWMKRNTVKYMVKHHVNADRRWTTVWDQWKVVFASLSGIPANTAKSNLHGSPVVSPWWWLTNKPEDAIGGACLSNLQNLSQTHLRYTAPEHITNNPEDAVGGSCLSNIQNLSQTHLRHTAPVHIFWSTGDAKILYLQKGSWVTVHGLECGGQANFLQSLDKQMPNKESADSKYQSSLLELL